MSRPRQLDIKCGECLLYGAIQGLSDGLILVDPDDRVFHMNRRARELLDLGSRHIVGTKLSSSIREPGLLRFWETIRDETDPVSTDLTIRGGASILLTASPCLSATREPIGKLLLLRDVTREKRIQVELSASVAQRLVEMAGGERIGDALSCLTPREREILPLLVEGLTNAGIARRLNLSANTVSSHLKNIYPKLKVTSRAQAVGVAISNGVRPSEPASNPIG